MTQSSKAKAVRAVQMAMELDMRVARQLKVQAALHDLTPQDYVRSLLGLGFRSPQRPRLSISLSDEDYEVLAQRYGLPAEDRADIKRAVISTLTEIARRLDEEAVRG